MVHRILKQVTLKEGAVGKSTGKAAVVALGGRVLAKLLDPCEGDGWSGWAWVGLEWKRCWVSGGGIAPSVMTHAVGQCLGA
jgi:hypothetical protein